MWDMFGVVDGVFSAVVCGVISAPSSWGIFRSCWCAWCRCCSSQSLSCWSQRCWGGGGGGGGGGVGGVGGGVRGGGWYGGGGGVILLHTMSMSHCSS